MCVLAWKGGTVSKPIYYLQPRNSMSSFKYLDNSCVEDAKLFLNKLYEFSGIAVCDRPTWKTQSTPINIVEQARGENSCGLHVVSQIILVSHGMWLTHTFDEGDIDILRLRLVDVMVGDGISFEMNESQ